MPGTFDFLPVSKRSRAVLPAIVLFAVSVAIFPLPAHWHDVGSPIGVPGLTVTPSAAVTCASVRSVHASPAAANAPAGITSRSAATIHPVLMAYSLLLRIL